MKRKYNNKHQALISFERETYDKFMELLPQGVSITDELNAYIKDRVLESETEKSLSYPITEKGAVKTNNGNGNGTSTIIEQKQGQGQQQTLDIYWSTDDLIKYVHSITDIETLKKLMKNGRLLSQLAETQMHKLQGTFKQEFKSVKFH